MEEKKSSEMTEAVTVTSISREDFLHPVIGFTISEAGNISDIEMREIVAKLGTASSNQIPKSSIKLSARTILKNRR